MKCVEFKENLVAYIERLLDEEATHSYQEHLSHCPRCRIEHEAFARLQKRLAGRKKRGSVERKL